MPRLNSKGRRPRAQGRRRQLLRPRPVLGACRGGAPPSPAPRNRRCTPLVRGSPDTLRSDDRGPQDVTLTRPPTETNNRFQRLFNFGGPGWLHNVVNVELLQHGDRVLDEKTNAFLRPYDKDCKAHVYQIPTDTIEGVVRLHMPPKTTRPIQISGVKIKLREFVLMLNTLEGTTLAEVDVEVCGPFKMNGTTDVPFKINLADIVKEAEWHESYNGRLFGLQHVLLTSVSRPWYTYPIEHRWPVQFQKHSPAPPRSIGDANPDAFPGEAPAPHVLPISDCDAICKFDYGCDAYNHDAVIRGQITITDVRTPIAKVLVELVRIEYADQEIDEHVVYSHTLHPRGTPKIAFNDKLEPDPSPPEVSEPAGAAEMVEVTYPIEKDRTMEIEIDLKAARVKPTVNQVELDWFFQEDAKLPVAARKAAKAKREAQWEADKKRKLAEREARAVRARRCPFPSLATVSVSSPSQPHRLSPPRPPALVSLAARTRARPRRAGRRGD